MTIQDDLVNLSNHPIGSQVVQVEWPDSQRAGYNCEIKQYSDDFVPIVKRLH